MLYSEPIEMAESKHTHESLQCNYDPYHLYALDNGYNQDVHKEFYDSEDRMYHTGNFVDDDDFDIPLEFLDDMLDEEWFEEADWDNLSDADIDSMMIAMNEVDPFDDFIAEDEEYLFDESYVGEFEEALWGEDSFN